MYIPVLHVLIEPAGQAGVGLQADRRFTLSLLSSDQ